MWQVWCGIWLRQQVVFNRESECVKAQMHISSCLQWKHLADFSPNLLLAGSSCCQNNLWVFLYLRLLSCFVVFCSSLFLPVSQSSVGYGDSLSPLLSDEAVKVRILQQRHVGGGGCTEWFKCKSCNTSNPTPRNDQPHMWLDGNDDKLCKEFLADRQTLQIYLTLTVIPLFFPW